MARGSTREEPDDRNSGERQAVVPEDVQRVSGQGFQEKFNREEHHHRGGEHAEWKQPRLRRRDAGLEDVNAFLGGRSGRPSRAVGIVPTTMSRATLPGARSALSSSGAAASMTAISRRK